MQKLPHFWFGQTYGAASDKPAKRCNPLSVRRSALAQSTIYSAVCRLNRTTVIGVVSDLHNGEYFVETFGFIGNFERPKV